VILTDPEVLAVIDRRLAALAEEMGLGAQE
jgi:hypothetical protein